MKGKLNIQISEKDRRLLMIVLIALIVFCAYYFGFRNINAMTLEVKQEREELVAKYNSLYPLYQDMDKYAERAKDFSKETETILSEFSNGMNQESLILLSKSIEEKTGIWFSSVTMSEIADAYTFGQITSTNPTRMGESVYQTDMVGESASLTCSYQVSYEQFKDLLAYVEKEKTRRISIQNVAMSYDEGENIVSGNLVLGVYDIKGSEREYPAMEIYDVPQGTDSIFRATLSAATAVSNIVKDYDTYITVLPYKEGQPNLITGLNKDAMNETVISSEANSVQTVTVTVTGANNDYYISYKMGDKTYPAENYFDGAAFACGDSIDLLVLSSVRAAAEDKSAVKINIVNSSDKTVNLFVYGDDTASPRVSLGTVTGLVNVEN